ncbi:MAG: hypothetical protein ABSH38_10780 [Verrucomicrobiota bacterium]|jgi:ribosomal protein L29
MTALQLRKQILLLESDLNRLRLLAECERLREAVGWVSRIREARRQIAPWALVLAPLAGVALALGIRRSGAGGGFLSRALGLAPSLIQLWRTCVWPSD